MSDFQTLCNSGALQLFAFSAKSAEFVALLYVLKVFLFQIFLHVIVVSSDVKIIVVFPPVGIAMATKIAQMVPMKTIAPPSLAQKTNSFVLREVPMPHPNA